MISTLIHLLAVSLVVSQSCHWNDGCSYQLFSSKTPYDTIRGDIRDYPIPQSCQAISVWTLNRHGNRNPGGSVTSDIKLIAGLKDEIVHSYYAGTSQLCAQDIENFRKWSWNDTIDVSPSFLTGTGYEELYAIATRIREKYPKLLEGSEDDFYFRTTNEQRTITSAKAFVHGLTENTNLNLSADGPWPRDDVIRAYENCDRYQQEVKDGQELEDQVNAYYRTSEFVNVQNNVQNRLGIATPLSPDYIYSFYEICRFHRSWQPDHRSPWCAVFTDEDLVVLEYRDDLWHYYRNGYGSLVNVDLGGPVVKDLYERMEASVQERGKKVIAYFTHDTMIEMALCAMGLFKDDYVLQGDERNVSRLWRTSQIGAFSANIMAVLSSCGESTNPSYRVQLFVNEKPTGLCPSEGCDWQDFRDIFQRFVTANLDFCNMDWRAPNPGSPGAAAAFTISSMILAAGLSIAYLVGN